MRSAGVEWLEGALLRGRSLQGTATRRGPGAHTDLLHSSEAHIEDAGGHSPSEKVLLYQELEALSTQVVRSIQALHEGQS
jgi:hypothetical protein